MRKGIVLVALTTLLGSLGCAGLYKGKEQNLRVTQGIDEAHRAMVKAYDAGAKENSPYLYSKAKAYKEVSYILASEMDDIGANVFSIRAINYASLSITSSFSGVERATALDVLDSKGVSGKEDILSLIDIYGLQREILFLRNNRGLKCAPMQTGKAEAFYDALVYELNKDSPNPSLVLRFYNEANTESKVAKNKVTVAKRNNLECYVGKKRVEQTQPKTAPPVKKKEELIHIKPGKAEIRKENLKIIARIHFDFDKYNIKREYKPILNEIVRTLKENPYVEVIVEGYTDNIGPKGYNDKLALKRARSVKNYLVKRGIPAEKIKITGIGKDKYVATNRTSIGRLTNRRVEFVIVKKAEQP